MVNEIQVTREELKRIKKELKDDGWRSAQYLIRRGFSADRLRSLAKKGELAANVLNIEGFQTSWYYKESSVEALREKGLI